MSRHQWPVQTTAGSDVQSGHLQVAEVRWHRHWDKTPKEHKKKPGFSLISGCWLIRYTLGFDPEPQQVLSCVFITLNIVDYFLRMTFCWVECAATYLTCKADTGMEWAPQIWRGRTHFDPQRLYGLNRMGMWWQTFLPAISGHVKSHICSLSRNSITGGCILQDIRMSGVFQNAIQVEEGIKESHINTWHQIWIMDQEIKSLPLPWSTRSIGIWSSWISM